MSESESSLLQQITSLYRNKQLDEALVLSQKSLTLFPNSPDLLSRHGSILFRFIFLHFH